MRWRSAFNEIALLVRAELCDDHLEKRLLELAKRPLTARLSAGVAALPPKLVEAHTPFAPRLGRQARPNRRLIVRHHRRIE